MKKLFFILFFFISANCFSQYTQQWANRLNGTASSFDIANNMFLDEQSNCYVYSTIYNSSNSPDICAVKYSPSGNIIWQYVYSSPGIDQLQDVYKDASNNSYLTGYTQDSGKIKLITIKLDSSGNSSWIRVTSVPGYENLISHSITLDNDGNVFVLMGCRNKREEIIVNC